MSIASVLEYQLHRFVYEPQVAVVGISGGVDSAVVAAICTNALGPNRVIGVSMPCGEQSTKDAERVFEYLKIKLNKVNIFNSMWNSLNSFPYPIDSQVVLGNLCARERMKILYMFANIKNGLVIGTGNRTEITLGYFTKYGDGGVDCLPIGNCSKNDVRKLATFYGFPNDIVNRVPSAELWEGQTDEGELEATYDQLDLIVDKYLHGEIYTDSTSGLEFAKRYGINIKIVEKLLKRIRNSVHKTEMPPIFAID